MTELPEIPVAFGHWVIQDGSLLCKLPRKNLTIRAPKKLLLDVMNFCDGTRTWEQAFAALQERWDGKILSAFLAELVAAGVLVESSLVLAHWADIAQLPRVTPTSAKNEELAALHRVAENQLLPGVGNYAQDIFKDNNPLATLLKSRESARAFADESISMPCLGAILWAAHGVTRLQESGSAAWHRTIASGGSMHSMRWFVVVLRPLESQNPLIAAAKPGIYEARFHQLGGVSLVTAAGSAQNAWRCLLDPRILTFASALILPVCDFAVASRKYGNRAVLYALMEVGQALQNAQLMAVQLKASSILRGDTIAPEVMKLMGLNAVAANATQFLYSVPAMVVGAKACSNAVQQQQVENLFKISPGLTTSANTFAFSARPVDEPSSPLFAASGSSTNPVLAMTKAESEGWERLAWASAIEVTRKNFEIAKFTQIESPIDPRELVAYSENQYARTDFPLAPFSMRRNCVWTQAVNVQTGNQHSVLADCVYAYTALPSSFQKYAYANTSTSGLAAGTSPDDALCRATLELIERDAFVCAWLGQQPPCAINALSMPASAATRIREFNLRGFRVVVSDISTNWAPVVSVFAQSNLLPMTIITAAADFSAEKALAKALDEVELQIACAEHGAPKKDDLYPMRQIEKYYRSKQTFRRSDFYADGVGTEVFKSVGQKSCRNWMDLQARIFSDRFDLLAVDITPKNAAIEQGRKPLHVVRAFIPGLLPIWFEAGMQPRGMARYLEHTVASSRRHAGKSFIHPFT